jgi:hypothetical protein
MVGLDLRDREKKIKDGRHVGLDFYDLLIKVDLESRKDTGAKAGANSGLLKTTN